METNSQIFPPLYSYPKSVSSDKSDLHKKKKSHGNDSYINNPSINHFTSSSFFIFQQYDNIKYFNSLNNKNSIKPTNEEILLLKSIFDEITLQKKIYNNDTFISLDNNIYEKIQSYFNIPKKHSDLSLFLYEKISKERNRAKLSCRKLSKLYHVEKGIKISKSTIHNILKKEMGLHYLKTTYKNNHLKEELGILSCFCFLKIFVRCIKLGFCPIFLDESKIELYNNHFKAWRFKYEELYFGDSLKDKRNLLLAVGKDQVYAYKITNESTTSTVFIDFLNNVYNSIKNDKSHQYFLIMDNLPAHKTYEVFQFLKEKKMPTLFNAAYKSIFNAIELSFRSIKKITYSNIYNSIEEVNKDIINYLENDDFKRTLLYNYKETIHQYILYCQQNSEINLNNFNI